DHGVTEEGVSAFPQFVTGEMIKNFSAGGAAISVLAQQQGAEFEVVNVGTVVDLPALKHVVDATVMKGTANFAHQAAMSPAQLAAALKVGKEAAERAHQKGATVFIGGDMGIGNTSAATALSAWVLDDDANNHVGPGTGLDAAGVSHKGQVIAAALAKHKAAMTSPLAALQYVGGLEIAALVGAYVRSAQLGMAILVDGFITTSAALIAAQIQPQITSWMFFSHASAEPGHQAMVKALGAKPILDLGMRLGEGSGAGVALSILKSACATHNHMATFAEAAVSEKSA
ncbi:MAG TPA: nicotinate-nucleotide--dimethylbenzimidazole phosphoribosyltransferase, partial [Oceanospirillaceae bacterium]|nr:nicotinate-nucleotide--dimethylbenzimidazole phosphoribosyltransferase [Oceanospirillaceae bacterium]